MAPAQSVKSHPPLEVARTQPSPTLARATTPAPSAPVASAMHAPEPEAATPELPARLAQMSQPTTDLAALAEQWRGIFEQLGLKAYARQLPNQSELIEWSANSLVLRCEKASLATDENALKVLRQHLERYFSERHQPMPSVQVHIAEAGQVRFSPQKLALQQREDHLAQAKAAITQHPTIQQIVHEFDGMILPNSITPE